MFSETKSSGAQNVSLPFHVDISPAGRVVVALREGSKKEAFTNKGEGGRRTCQRPTRVMVLKRGEVGPGNILKWTTNQCSLKKLWEGGLISKGLQKGLFESLPRDILIFNRVPKTASLNIFTILEGLGAKLGFDIATRL